MTLYDKRKNKLIGNLKDKEYRDAFVEENINVGISFQVKSLRKQREWTQNDLAKHTGMKQTRISLLEDPNYSRFSLATLKRLASAFDVGLIVRFAPISDLVKWELDLTPRSLEALSFNQDPYFKKEPEVPIRREQEPSKQFFPLSRPHATEDVPANISTIASRGASTRTNQVTTSFISCLVSPSFIKPSCPPSTRQSDGVCTEITSTRA